MGFHSYRGDFLKGYDRYAKPVSLTYLKSGSYRTAAGGIATIVGFCMLFYWVCVNVFYALYDSGTYTKSDSSLLAQNEDGSYPLYEITKNQFLIAYDISDINRPEATGIRDYAVGVWAQVNSDQTIDWILPKPCSEVYPKSEVGDIFY